MQRRTGLHRIKGYGKICSVSGIYKENGTNIILLFMTGR